VRAADAIIKSRNAGRSWRGSASGLVTNAVDALAVDPVTSTVYAGAAGLGLVRSLDGGQSWTPSNTGLQFPNVESIAIDPTNSSIMYAGQTNEWGDAGGVFKSTDGGATWSGAGLDTLSSAIWAVAVSPSTPSRVYAATFPIVGNQIGLFKSSDGGATWTGPMLQDIPVTSIAVDPTDADTVYAGTFRQNVFKSTDGGATWTQLSGGLYNWVVASLVVDPDAPATICMATHAPSPGSGGVFRRTDGGATWTPISQNIIAQTLVVDPTDSRTMYVGAYDGLYKTTDGGARWTQIHSVGDNVRSIAIDPRSPSSVYAGLFVDGF
jgi:photosystem II stability/assembly factor-like uncharacterized protein